MRKRQIAGRTRIVCPNCGFVLDQNKVTGLGVLVEMDGCVVLVRRGHNPFKGLWALPSGFIEADESIEEAAIREYKEETGLDVVRAYGEHGRDLEPVAPITARTMYRVL